ncbi:GSCFA domain-containing protein [Pseudoroseicyclus sp. H15]
MNDTPRNSGAPVPAKIVFKRTRQAADSRWPKPPNHARLTPVCQPVSRPGFTLEAGETVFTMGSCFARNVEARLAESGFDVPMRSIEVPPEELLKSDGRPNSLVNKYTPVSMRQEIDFAFGQTDGSEFLIESEKGWIDTQLHTNVPVSFERGLERRASLRRLFADSISKARIHVLTLGLIETWIDTETGLHLNEMPSLQMVRPHPDRFMFQVLPMQACVDAVDGVIRALKENGREDQKVVLTVSPVPLRRTFTEDDVIVANGYSKALLRVAAEQMRVLHDHVDYFGSYESVTTSDRGFAWSDDLIHPSSAIVRENIERLVRDYVAPADQAQTTAAE